MKESTPEREARRHISKQLTAQIARSTRRRIPTSARSWSRPCRTSRTSCAAMSSKVRRDYSLKPDEPLMFFYVKGGNALDALLERPAQPPPTLFDFGRSDWDTQVVINPDSDPGPGRPARRRGGHRDRGDARRRPQYRIGDQRLPTPTRIRWPAKWWILHRWTSMCRPASSAW